MPAPPSSATSTFVGSDDVVVCLAFHVEASLKACAAVLTAFELGLERVEVVLVLLDRDLAPLDRGHLVLLQRHELGDDRLGVEARGHAGQS